MNYYDSKKGWIEVIAGPMFAGKTEELIRRVKRMEYAKKNYMIFKPAIDTRYSKNEVVSHNKKTLNAISISHGSDIKRHLKDDTQAIVIDEVQFFDESLLKYVMDFADNGYRVICAGLDTDFRGEPFGVVGPLMAVSESVTKLTAICCVCGEEATRTQRIIDGKPAFYDDPIILVGANDSYEARCRCCHQVIKHE
ncbi:TPA: thymidine kinase [Candidatus Avacholeplasma faecigallinarum]|nr:thymidine kinase [Candidatus Avacholeplasma faecigallinarum]